MIKYKGYYIDNTCFKNKKEVDEFIENQAVNAYKKAVRYFAEHTGECALEASIYASEKAEVLVNQFKYTWEEVEKIEIETLKSI